MRHSEETKRKISETRKVRFLSGEIQHPRGMIGKRHSESTRAKMQKTHTKIGTIPPHGKGAACPAWIKDRSKLKTDRRGRHSYDTKYRNWMKAIKDRDGWKCKIANKDCEGRLEAHHILSWREYSELRYETNNGITLCHAHHPRVRSEEKRLQAEFQILVATASRV